VDPELVKSCPLTQHFSTWATELKDDHDAAFILNGIAHGFPLVDDPTSVPPADCANYASALAPDIKPGLDKLFSDELTQGRISLVDNPPHRINALGAVKKPSGEPRPITDLSAPRGNSVNDFITCESFRYNTIDDVIKRMKPNTYFSVVDIRQAYRAVPIRGDCRQLQGFRWKFDNVSNCSYCYFTDNRLCFGARNSPAIFNRLSAAITRMMERRGFKDVVIHYLDDYLLLSYSRSRCFLAQQTLIQLLHSLGFSISWPKVQSVSTRVTFLGITLDSVTMRAYVNEDKIVKLHSLLDQLLLAKKASKHQLQCVAGYMSHLSKVIKGARTFTRRIFDRAATLRSPHHKCRLTYALKQDLFWWKSWASHFNGQCVIFGHACDPPVHIYCDASLHCGYSAYLSPQHWLCGTWSKDTQIPSVIKHSTGYLGQPGPDVPSDARSNINLLELYAILQTLRHWGPQLCNKRIFIHSDSTSAKAWLNTGVSHSPIAMAWLREIFWLSVVYNFHVTCLHIPGIHNKAADMLSRANDPKLIHQFLVDYTQGIQIASHD
jgi:hypothetical protein